MNDCVHCLSGVQGVQVHWDFGDFDRFPVQRSCRDQRLHCLRVLEQRNACQNRLTAMSRISAGVRSGAILTSSGGGPAGQAMRSRVDLTAATSRSSCSRPCSALSPAQMEHYEDAG